MIHERQHPLLEINECAVLELEGRSSEALARLERIDGSAFTPLQRLAFDNNRAWYLGRAGRIDESRALAEQTVAGAHHRDSSLLPRRGAQRARSSRRGARRVAVRRRRRSLGNLGRSRA